MRSSWSWKLLGACVAAGLTLGLGGVLLHGSDEPKGAPASSSVEAAPWASAEPAKLALDTPIHPVEAEPLEDQSKAQQRKARPTRREAAGPPASPSAEEWASAPEQALGRVLGLSPEQAEEVGELLRAREEELRREMALLADEGYDDVAAQHLCTRYEASVIEEVAAVLPEEAVPRFRALMRTED